MSRTRATVKATVGNGRRLHACMLLATFGVASVAAAGTIYVDPICGYDGWDGRCRTWNGECCGPKRTIQAGIDEAGADEEVVLAPGVYVGAGNKNLGLSAVPITIRSEDDDPSTCIIDCEKDGRGVGLGDYQRVTLRGITIKNGLVAGNGGAVYCGGRRSAFTLINCAILGNSAAQGGGIWAASYTRGWLNVIDCVISENSASGNGGGMFINYFSIDASNTIFSNNSSGDRGGGAMLFAWAGGGMCNCLFYKNSAARYGGGIHMYDASENLSNCTFSGNTAGVVGGAVGMIGYSEASLNQCVLWDNYAPDHPELWVGPDAHVEQIAYTDIRGGWSGEGNIDEDPLFVDPAAGDFRLQIESPCVDTGDPTYTAAGALDLDGRIRLWDGDGDGVARADMGAHEFAAHVYGDVNCDDVIDPLDIDPFVLALVDPGAYAASYPLCSRMTADTNGDGAVNAFDIDPLVGLLVGG